MERLLFPLRAAPSEANRGKNTDFLPIFYKMETFNGTFSCFTAFSTSAITFS